MKEDTDLFIIDEVGKMELYSSFFFPAVLRVLDSNIPLLATVPVPKNGRDIPGGLPETLTKLLSIDFSHILINMIHLCYYLS